MTNTVNISRTAAGLYRRPWRRSKRAAGNTILPRSIPFFDGARAYRDSFIDAGSGPIKKDYSIRLDIPDEAGSIAAVSTLFGAEQHQHQKYRHRP